MTCRLSGAKSLSEPMQTNSQLDPIEHISMNSYLKFRSFHSKKCTLRYRLQNGGHLYEIMIANTMIFCHQSHQAWGMRNYLNFYYDGTRKEHSWLVIGCRWLLKFSTRGYIYDKHSFPHHIHTKDSKSYLLRHIHNPFNSSLPSAAYMRQWIGSALVQILPCRIFGVKPLSKAILVYSQLDP